MLKDLKKIHAAKQISKKEQKTIKAGFLLPVSDCCSCVFRPAGSMFPIFITQSCDDPCPTDGALEWRDTGC